MATLRYKKVYIDTKYMTADSNSSTDFKIELPECILCPENTVFYVDSIGIPNSWWSIESGINNNLYLSWTDTSISTNYYFIINITPGNYTGADLAVELQSDINTAVYNTKYPNMFSCTYNSKRNTVQISINYTGLTFQILTPNDLQTNLNNTWLGASYDTTKPNDINEVLSNLEGNSPSYDHNTPFISGFINLAIFRNVYLHSSTLGTFETVSVGLNQSTIIKKIPVSSDYSNMIFDNIVVYNDFLDCSKQCLKKIDFQLKSSRGDIVPLHGCNLSFTLVFAKANSDV